MERPRTPIAVTAGRTVMGACWTSACWIVWVLLLVVAGFLLTIEFRHEIPVPAFLVKRLEARFAEAQLQPRFGATRFDPKGTLVLEDVRIHSPLFTEPVASARAIVLKLDLWAVFIGDFDVDAVDIIGLDLNCPAMFSPSGMNLPVVHDLHATFERDGPRWRVPQADFRIGQLSATLRGEWDPGGAAGAKLPVAAKDWVRRYYEVARTVSHKLAELAALGETRLDASFTIRRDTPLHVSLEVEAQRLNARGISLANARISADYDVARRPAPPLVVEVSAPDVMIEDRLRIEHPRIRATGEFELNPLKFTPGPLEFIADGAAWDTASVDSLIFRTSLAALPVVEGELAVSHGAAVVQALGTVDPRDGSVTANVSARLDPATLEEGLDMATRQVKSRMLPRLHFGGPVSLDAVVRLGDHWKFRDAEGRFQALDADILGVPATVASGLFNATRTHLFANDLVLDGMNLRGRGSYEMDFATRDYRFLIKGRTFPETIEPWFKDWWTHFWSRFSFASDSPAVVDLAINGRWRSRHETLVAGSVATGPMTVYELPFDHVSTRIFIRDEYYDILEVHAGAGDRHISGSFTYDNRESGDSLRRIRFDARSTLKLPEYTRLASPELPRILEPYVFEGPANLITSGTVDFRESGISEDVSAQVTSSGTFRFFEFPVQNVVFDLRSHDGALDIRDIAADLASGKLTATAQSEVGAAGRTIHFNARLASAKLDETAAALADFHRRTSPADAKKSEAADSVLSGKGVLNLELEASGPAENPWGLSGKGTATVSQAELGHIRLFGPLSKLFEGTILNFSSFRLTDANATFTLNGTRLEFGKLELTGPSAQLRSFGNFNMKTSELEFNTTIFPFRESSMPVFGLIGFVLEPFSRALELRLSGTLDKPRWAFAAGASVPKYQPVAPPKLTQPNEPVPQEPAAETPQPSGPDPANP